jgi:S-formylglutathione hydrolase FrmB
MSLVTFNFESEYLGNNHTVGVILPDKPRTQTPKEFYGSGKKYKVLWLLHGTFGDYSDWIRKSMIELYACEHDLIVVMPSALNSNYANWPSFGTGFNMYDYLFEELMPLIYNWFPASDKREDNFVAGLSMGGRGTCVMAFNHPEKFAAAAVLSSMPSDLNAVKAEGGHMWERMKKSVINFDSEEEFLNSYQNTAKMLKDNIAAGVDMPRLMFACGESDMLYEGFKKFRAEAEEMNLGAEFYTLPNYKHEWRFWDLAIQKALEFFGIADEETVGNPF